MDAGPTALLRQAVAQRLVVLGTLPTAEATRVAHDPGLTGSRFAERAYLAGLVTDEQIVAACLSLGARDCTRIMDRDVAPEVKALLPEELARRHRLVPFQWSGGRLHVAMLDPFDDEARAECVDSCRCILDPWVARASVLFDVLCRCYGGTPPVPRLPPRARSAAPRASVAVPSRTPALALPAHAAPQFAAEAPVRRRATQPGIPVAPPARMRIPVASLPPRPPSPHDEGSAAAAPGRLLVDSLVPPFRTAALLRADGAHARLLHAAGASPGTAWTDARLSLQEPSALRGALLTQFPAYGAPGLASDVERALWAALDPRAGPRPSWSVWPVAGGELTSLLLYVDGCDPRADAGARAALHASMAAWERHAPP